MALSCTKVLCRTLSGLIYRKRVRANDSSLVARSHSLGESPINWLKLQNICGRLRRKDGCDMKHTNTRCHNFLIDIQDVPNMICNGSWADIGIYQQRSDPLLGGDFGLYRRRSTARGTLFDVNRQMQNEAVGLEG